jgi:hypothetical protein
MKKINIWKKDKKIGELWFDEENKTIRIQFEENERKEYEGAVKIVIDRVAKRVNGDFVFDKESGQIKNVDENVVLAIKQELFLNLNLILN